MDEVMQQLRREGLDPRFAYLPGCNLLLGQQVELYPYRFVYRIDKDHLILCSFHRVPGSQPRSSSLVGLWRILRRLFQQVSWLRAVRMLVITDVWDRLLRLQRQKLVRLLCKLGAVMVLRNDENWLEIAADRLRNRRKLRVG